jgi:menaquinone-specific isochorismate synthase
MLDTPANSRPPAERDWLRLCAPSADDIREFIHCGALIAWSEDCWFIAWGTPEKSAAARPGFPSFYAPDFLLSDPEPWRIYPKVAAVSPDGLAHQLDGRPQPRAWHDFESDAFARTFAAVEIALDNGSLAKVVPAVFDRSDAPLGAAERERALRSLANLPAGLMPYGCWDSEGGTLGASPELLFEDDGVEIHTMAVAGTARAGTAPDDMMHDPKERAEHALVLDDLAAQLEVFGPVSRGTTRLWRIGILSHLRTDLRVSPEHPADFAGLVRRLHPTPAVGIAPRDDWRAWIPRFDTEPRGKFAAPFGLVLPGAGARCLVAIRGVQWDRRGLRCGAGCGLVRGSKLPRELSELRLKLAATRGNLGL